MPSRGGTPAVQGRHAQAAAVADALASLGRTRARMASLTAYGNGGRSWALGAPGAGRPGSRLITLGNFGARLPGGSGREGARLQRALACGWGTDALCNWRMPGTWEGGVCRKSRWSKIA